MRIHQGSLSGFTMEVEEARSVFSRSNVSKTGVSSAFHVRDTILEVRFEEL